jgi:hypothetical protein
VIRQSGDLVHRMGDIDDRQRQFAVQALEVRQDLGLARRVQRGQWFVHQQQPRAGCQRAGDRHALSFPARQRGRAPRLQVPDAQQFDHRIKCDALTFTRGALSSVVQVAAHIEVREQRSVLDHIAERPAVRGHEAAGGIVLPHLVVQRDTAGRAIESGQGSQNGRLATA